MRCMLRNKSKFYYASYIGETEIIDEYGNATGEYAITYGNPIKSFGNISAAMGEKESRQFGESESYDKVIVLDLHTLLTDNLITTLKVAHQVDIYIARLTM